MAAPQIAGTSAAPAAAAPAESVDVASHGIDAILGDLAPEEMGATEEAPADEGTEPAEPTETPEAEPADPAKKLDDDVLFSDDALGTKEGLLRAKSRIHQLRKLSHEKYLELKKFEGRVKERGSKLKNSVDKFVSEKRQHQLLIDNVRSNLQGLHSGDPDAIMTALGNLTGTDGIKALELLNSRLMNRGRPMLDPQVQAIIDQQQAQIEELKQGFTQRETLAQIQQKKARIEHHKQGIGQRIEAEAASLPHLARMYKERPQHVIEYIADEIIEKANAGMPVDGRTYFGNLEAELAAAYKAAAAPQGDGGGPAPKQPAPITAPRSPGQSIGPRSAAPSTPRQPSEEESLRALASDDALMSQFGF